MGWLDRTPFTSKGRSNFGKGWKVLQAGDASPAGHAKAATKAVSGAIISPFYALGAGINNKTGGTTASYNPLMYAQPVQRIQWKGQELTSKSGQGQNVVSPTVKFLGAPATGLPGGTDFDLKFKFPEFKNPFDQVEKGVDKYTNKLLLGVGILVGGLVLVSFATKGNVRVRRSS